MYIIYTWFYLTNTAHQHLEVVNQLHLILSFFLFLYLNYAEITTHPQSTLAPDGSSVNLTCTSSVSSDVTFSWTRNGKDIRGQSTSTDDTSILTIKARSRNAGDYVCTVRSGPLSVMSNTATMTVYSE